MTQQERQARSRAKIFEAALAEFGSHSFEDVTMDAICAGHAISKGMMYHYYSRKEDLFLLCVEHTFRQLAQFLAQRCAALESLEPAQAIQAYFAAREEFFAVHPQEKTVFESAMLRPPAALQADIARLREPVARQNRTFLTAVTHRLSLRPGVSQEDAARYLEGIEAVFPTLLRNGLGPGADMAGLMKASQAVLEWILFGIARE